jgi:hypothetical protein
LAWLLDLASGSVGYPERIQSFINRADWKGLTDWLGTVASPAVMNEFQERGWPPVPKIYHGLMPKLTTADYVSGKPKWQSIPFTLAELEAAAAAERAAADEIIPTPEAIF